ncbi:hypothetical protein BOX15_Mlig027638g4 [Macrostomum lignano]|uniref:ThiF domain-containing protein n=2 Tax=Macrostomum lignano TaxID=282301 RepID=A0A1I8G2W3_9PLAT|nr:hypothetical protein BOX15_Mlig027638g4 [Macrostomum lignano]
MTSSAVEAPTDITAQEAELYDRQIRLWGLDAQKRLRASRILMVGAPPLTGEIAKNLVLAGIRSLTLMDDSPLSADDIDSSFIYDPSLATAATTRAEAALSALHSLNPMVEVSAKSGQPEQLTADVLANEDYDAVLAISQPVEVLQSLGRLCRSVTYDGEVNSNGAGNNSNSDSSAKQRRQVQFFAADCFGCHGYVFLDLQRHEFATELAEVPPKAGQDSSVDPKTAAVPAAGSQPVETHLIKRSADYADFESVLRTRWDPAKLGSLRRLSPALYLAFLLFEFQRANNGARAGPNDVDALKTLWRAFAESQQLPANLLDEAVLSSGLQPPSCPVLAIVGGVAAQEVIKAVSHKDDPFNNFFVFDGIQSCGSVQTLG